MIDAMQAWLAAGQEAIVDDIALMPRRAEALSTSPLATTGEQASVYYLVDDNDRGWVLKKFSPGTQPDPAYVEAIQALIPQGAGLESGFERKVLHSSSVSPVAYCDADLLSWIEGTILMRQVAAPTWAELAESIKDGSKVLPRIERLLLCRKLSEKVEWLESASLAHRDLAGANVMMDAVNVDVHLIDWDSLYHPTLAMPSGATCGTGGYIAPFVKVNGAGKAHVTWREGADRFSLAILNAELMAMSAGSTLASGGGLFEQEDLNQRSGRSVQEIRKSLLRTFPAAVKLLDAALTATSFDKCPRPSHWIELVNRELPNSAQAIWEEESTPAEEVYPTIYPLPYEPHFVEINKAAFVKLDKRALVKAPTGRRH